MYYAFDSPPLVVPEPVFAQPAFTGDPRLAHSGVLCCFCYGVTRHATSNCCNHSSPLSHCVGPPAVKLFLDEALSDTTTVQQLLTLCMVADALIERVHRVENSGSTFDLSVLQKIEAACMTLNPRKSAQVGFIFSIHGR